MITFVRHHEINKFKWDACIKDAGYSIIYGYSWYLDIVSPGWDALIDGDYESVFPLTWRKKYGLYYLTQPIFAQQLGIFSKISLNDHAMCRFLESIPSDFIHYDINLNPRNMFTQPDPKYALNEFKTYHLPLNSCYSQVFTRYSKDTKRNIKIVTRKNLTLKPVAVEEVAELYKKNVWFKTPALRLKDYHTLKKLAAEVSARNQCISLGAFENGTLSAGAIFFLTQSKIIFIFGAANKFGRKNGAMRFIIDTIIQDNCNKNYVLDFEGSSVQTVEYFYKSFGPDKITFYNLNYSRFGVLKNILATKQVITKMFARRKIKKMVSA